MSDLTYINKELTMEGTLQAKESQVVVAGKFKGNITAKTVILESTSIFDGILNAEHLKIEGRLLVKSCRFLEITGSGNFDGKLNNSLSVDMGAKVSGNVGNYD